MADDLEQLPGQPSRSPAITRTAAILSVLAANPKRAVRPGELSRLVDVPKSTVLNLCGALLDAGLLRRGGGGYQLGSRLAELGNAYLRSVSEVEEFYDLCREWYPAAVQTVQLGVLGDGLTLVYLARHDGTEPLNLGLAAEIGRSVPATCTATGKAVLAALPGDALARRLPRDGRLSQLTERSLDTAQELDKELASTRERGYSVENGEIIAGLRCVGVAVRTPRRADELVGVSFTLAGRSAPVDLSGLGAELRGFADAFAGRIGGSLAC